VRCVHCSDVLDPSIPTPAAPTPPLMPRTIAIVGGVAALLIAVLHFAGLGFSMRLLPAEAPHAELVSRMSTLVDEDIVDSADARALTAQLQIERDLRAELRSGTLSESEAIAIRDRLPEDDQATVIGVRGIFGLVPVVIAFLAAAAVGTGFARGRQVREVALGLAAASGVQLLLWAVSVEFDIGALVGGRLLMAGPGPAFAGGPILLLVVTLVFATAAASGLGFGVGIGLEQAMGKADCPHCGHVFPRAKGQLHCPACTRPLEVAQSVSAGPGGMTRASTGADALLCIQCAKTYAADACPVHPAEPLLDPRRDDVRLQLLDLDTQQGTRRFAQWTEGLGVGPQDVTTPTSGGVCLECAKAYDQPTCPVHPDEPLLDPSREEVRLEMEDADARRRNQVGTRLMFAGFALAAAGTVGLSSVLDLDGQLLISTFAGSLLALMAVARVLTPALSPPRYGPWTGAQAQSSDALAADARRELLGPLQRHLAGALAHLGALIATATLGAILGGLLAFVLTWPVALGAVGGLLLGLVVFVLYRNVVDTSKDVRQAAKSAAAQWRDPYA